MQERERYSLAVIIPNYNKEKYLYECVLSILRQTLLPNEIIIVDDGSSDHSREIIDKLKEEYDLIQAVFLEKNGGVSRARNIGLKTSRSEYVTFLDSDDFYYNYNKLENEMNLIKKIGDDIVAYSQLVFVGAEGIKLEMRTSKAEYLNGDIFARLLTGKFTWPAIAKDYCIKKSILVQLGGYNEQRDLYEDFELLLKLAKEHPFLCTYEEGSAYRQVQDGLSKRVASEHKKARQEIFLNSIESLPFVMRHKYTFQWKYNRLYTWFQGVCVQPVKNMVKAVLGRK